jgi:hypothetical protein
LEKNLIRNPIFFENNLKIGWQFWLWSVNSLLLALPSGTFRSHFYLTPSDASNCKPGYEQNFADD